jgi:alpha-beta hydrolase superfamily lysophospholipase
MSSATDDAAHRVRRWCGPREYWLAIALLVTSGCAHDPRTDLEPDPHALDSWLATEPRASRVEHTFRTADDAELGLVSYRQQQARSSVALVYLHGIESHAGWFETAARLLRDGGYDVFCLDRRGSGINRENRGFVSGHIDRFDTLLTDVKFFVRPLRQHYEHVFLMGLSWGGKLALAYALTYPEDCGGLVLITPGLRALVDVDGPTKLRVFFANGLDPQLRVKIPIKPEMFTVTPEHLAFIRQDPLRLTEATARFLFESRRLDQYIERRMSENELPILLFLAGKDRIIDNDGVQTLLRRGGQASLRIIEYADQTHSIQFDAPQRMVADVVSWLAWARETDAIVNSAQRASPSVARGAP